MKTVSAPSREDIALTKGCYIAGLAICAFAVLLLGAFKLFHIPLSALSPVPCAFRTYLGIYCPGCGGTRAVISLLHGRILESLKYHPLVPYTAFCGGWFMISNTLSYATKGRFRGMLFRPVYLYIAAALIFVTWVIRLIAIFAFGVRLIG